MHSSQNGLLQISDGQQRLKNDWTKFTRSWQAAKQQWHDRRCQQFELEYLAALPPTLGRLTVALQELQTALREAENELRDQQQAQ